MESPVTLLEREVYAEAEAARLLGVPQSTLHYWLEGRSQDGKTYAPVIRSEPTGSRAVTWGEFVEAAWLRRYRQQRIPMLQLRRFIDTLREELGVPYPLADRRPWMSGNELLFHAQSDADLPTSFWLVSNQQGLLTPVGQGFVDQITWKGDLAMELRPAGDPESTVRIDPAVRFGQPNVRGISTAAIYGEVEGGASFDEVAADFDIPVSDVRWAHAYESTRMAA